MSVKNIINTFNQWKESKQTIVLATVYETLGSTYSKAGQRIIINNKGDYQGLVSGGCLEGDIVERANSVISENNPEIISYDMRDEVDDIFGLGAGCNGLIRIILQPLLPAKNYEPLTSINRAFYKDRSTSQSLAQIVTIIDSSKKEVSSGDTIITDKDSNILYSSIANKSLVNSLLKDKYFSQNKKAVFKNDLEGISALYSPITPIPKILILGAGLDSIPIIEMSSILGWRTTIVDHRPAYFEKNNFEDADESILITKPEDLIRRCDLNSFDAVVVMSHHLASDKAYLEQLKDKEFSYLGLLGPIARKNRIINSIDKGKYYFKDKLRGPVGIPIGADSPGAIALSLLAEIYSKIN
jgi:xanthine/CO dehydrogenase XdhC/CoxF family maturation factor